MPAMGTTVMVSGQIPRTNRWFGPKIGRDGRMSISDVFKVKAFISYFCMYGGNGRMLDMNKKF